MKSSFKKEYIEKIKEFFNYEPFREVKIPHYKKGELAYEEVKLYPNKPRFLTDFARSIGVPRSSLNEWVKKFPEFAEAFKEVKEINNMKITQGALMGVYTPGAFIFTMKNIAGWRDTKDLKVDGELKVSKIKVEFVDGKDGGNESGESAKVSAEQQEADKDTAGGGEVIKDL